MNNFKKLKSVHYFELSKYYTGFFANRKYPRYWMSLAELISTGYCYFAVENDCLLVLVRRWLGFPVCYFIIPPISLSGNLGDERKVLEKYTDLGFSFRLSDEDITLYGLDKESLRNRVELKEYIYDSKDYDNLSGSKFRRLRYEISRVFRELNPVDHGITNFYRYRVAVDFYSNWVKERSKVKAINKKNRIEGFPIDEVLSQRIAVSMCKGSVGILYVDVTELVHPGKGVILVRSNRTDTKCDLGLFMHYHEMSRRKDFVYNMGCNAGDKGLDFSKNKMKPCTVLNLYDTKETSLIDEKLWKTIGENE